MEHIVGQPAAIETLTNALASGRVHHAWVFHGPHGVGKFTTATAFAKVLLCPNAQADLTGRITACSTCESCRLIDSEDGAHPDLHVITKELALFSDDASTRNRKLMTIPLDVLRTRLLGPAYLRASMNHGKVFIIDEAELLDLNGQNTLLKTLEEPPEGTYLILVTAHDERLLPTIRSRCQRVSFGRLDDEQVAQWVNEQPDVEPAHVEQIVRFARGSIGRAALAIEFELDSWVRKIEPMVDDLAKGRAVPELGATMAKLADDYAAAWVDSRKNASKDAANKAAIRTLVGLLGALCSERLESLAPTCDANDPAGGEATLRPWLVGVELLQEAELQLTGNVAPALLLDNLAVQWAASSLTTRKDK
jgi:DNA polymerase-3 subunit delta'